MRAQPHGAARRLVMSGVVVGGAIALANVLTAITQLALARILHPADFSLVVTLFVVIAVASVPLGALQATIARTVAAERSIDGPSGAGRALRASARELLRLATPAALVAIAIAVPLGYWLHVQRVGPVILMGVTIAASVALTLVTGGLQGMQRFGVLSIGQVALALIKLAGAVGAARAGAGVAGVMGAIGGATVIVLALGFLPLLPAFRASHGPVHARTLATRYSAAAAAALMLFAVLTTLDVITARLALSPAASGQYAAASVAARALLLVPMTVTLVLFPQVVTLADRRRERRHLRAGLFVTGALVSVPVALLLVAGRRIVELVFGHAYATAGSSVGLLSVAMALYALAYVDLFHSLAVNRTRYWRFAAGVLAGQIAGFAFFHDHPRDFVLVQLATAAALAVGGHALERRR